jgi:hypothetical protein
MKLHEFTRFFFQDDVRKGRSNVHLLLITTVIYMWGSALCTLAGANVRNKGILPQAVQTLTLYVTLSEITYTIFVMANTVYIQRLLGSQGDCTIMIQLLCD